MSFGRRDLIAKFAGIVPGLGLISLNLPTNLSSNSNFLSTDIKLIYRYKYRAEDFALVVDALHKVYDDEVQIYIKEQISKGVLKGINRVAEENQVHFTLTFANREMLNTFVAGVEKVSKRNNLYKLIENNIIKFEKTIA